MPDVISYDTFDQKDLVIILGSGPSIGKNFKRIEKISKKFKSVIIACSYNYEIFADYTVFIDSGQFRRNIDKIRTKKVIVSPCMIPSILNRTDHEWLILDMNESVQPYDVDDFIVDEKGKIGHKMANCGFAAMFMAHFFKPKIVLAAGFDGPDKGIIKRYNGRNTKYEQKDIDRTKPKIEFLRHRLLPFLKSHGIKVYRFSNDPFRGVSEVPCFKETIYQPTTE